MKRRHLENVDAWKRKDTSLVYTNISIKLIEFLL
jgi:hypothetical protein